MAAVVGFALSVGLIVLFIIFLARTLVRPITNAARMAGRLEDGDLSARMPGTGVAEIGTLERSFNSLATTLEESRAVQARLLDQQSALRRLAVLVAQSREPDEVFSAVVRELSDVSPERRGVPLAARVRRQLRTRRYLGAARGAAGCVGIQGGRRRRRPCLGLDQHDSHRRHRAPGDHVRAARRPAGDLLDRLPGRGRRRALGRAGGGTLRGFAGGRCRDLDDGLHGAGRDGHRQRQGASGGGGLAAADRGGIR